MTASKDTFGGTAPGRRVVSPTCRRRGCGEPACSHEGFCAGCKRAYEQARKAREEDLRQTARMLALANPEWDETFARAQPGQYELMLTHTAAHHLQRGEPRSEAMSLDALHDYLSDTMDRIREAGEEGSG